MFCIAGWEELQTASYKFRGKIIVLNAQNLKTISCKRLGIFFKDRLQHLLIIDLLMLCFFSCSQLSFGGRST